MHLRHEVDPGLFTPHGPIPRCCRRSPTTASHFGGPPASHQTFRYSGTADGALCQLDDAHDAYVSGVRSLGAAGLADPQGPDYPSEYADAPKAKLFLYNNLEIIHHGAEISLLRDLYLWHGSQDRL